ncbi:MAG TPA: hypothetical protein VG098_03965 [Nitrososphaera sp.]|nr:hypothetical protein [Nitrososphaera sp.]
MRYILALIMSIIAATIIVISALFMVPEGKIFLTTLAANSTDEGKLTIVSVSDNFLANQSKYIISPNPFENFANYTIQDGKGVEENSTAGIAEISGLPDGRYAVTQIGASSQYHTDGLPNIVEISNLNRSGITTFNNVSEQEREQQRHHQLQNQTAPIRDLAYYVKFECGTISGNEGPLRPGHYDTDIGILNKQDFPTQIQWSITANNSRNTNSIIRTLEPQGSINIVCKDLRNLIGNDQRFVEGFVIINVPLEPGLLGSLSQGTQVLGRNFEAMNNFIEVQAFYTANALDQLPHSVFVDKITFRILNDTSGKISMDVMNKTLDVTVPSGLNQISDPEIKVKDLLAVRYGLSTQERINLQIVIENVTGSVGAMIDDHAISLSTVMPQASR